MSQLLYRQVASNLASGSLVWTTDTIKVLLLNTDYDFTEENKTVSDLVANEVVASNYIGGFGGTGRKLVSTKSIVSVGDEVRLHGSLPLPTWPTLGNGQNSPVGSAIFFKEDTDDASSPLIGFWDGPFPLVTNGEDLNLSVNVVGLFSIKVQR